MISSMVIMLITMHYYAYCSDLMLCYFDVLAIAYDFYIICFMIYLLIFTLMIGTKLKADFEQKVFLGIKNGNIFRIFIALR